ncbi:hypothetical protein Tco_1276351 [Tanacetum coccineum]
MHTYSIFWHIFGFSGENPSLLGFNAMQEEFTARFDGFMYGEISSKTRMCHDLSSKGILSKSERYQFLRNHLQPVCHRMDIEAIRIFIAIAPAKKHVSFDTDDCQECFLYGEFKRRASMQSTRGALLIQSTLSILSSEEAFMVLSRLHRARGFYNPYQGLLLDNKSSLRV